MKVKLLPLGILTILAIMACIFSNRNAEAIDPTLEQMIRQDHASLGLVIDYLTNLQEKGILPAGKQ